MAPWDRRVARSTIHRNLTHDFVVQTTKLPAPSQDPPLPRTPLPLSRATRGDELWGRQEFQ